VCQHSLRLGHLSQRLQKFNLNRLGRFRESPSRVGGPVEGIPSLKQEYSPSRGTNSRRMNMNGLHPSNCSGTSEELARTYIYRHIHTRGWVDGRTDGIDGWMDGWDR
jgi:hypothetical protein